MTKVVRILILTYIAMQAAVLFSCSKENDAGPEGTDTTTVKAPPFDINAIADTYADLAPFDYHSLWGPYNVHDPSIIKDGEYYYCYSTDAAFGISVPPGIQIRKSKDLI